MNDNNEYFAELYRYLYSIKINIISASTDNFIVMMLTLDQI